MEISELVVTVAHGISFDCRKQSPKILQGQSEVKSHVRLMNKFFGLKKRRVGLLESSKRFWAANKTRLEAPSLISGLSLNIPNEEKTVWDSGQFPPMHKCRVTKKLKTRRDVWNLEALVPEEELNKTPILIYCPLNEKH